MSRLDELVQASMSRGKASDDERRLARERLAHPLDLQNLEAEAGEILGDAADAWLDEENVRLDGNTPREMLKRCNKKAVREVLDGIRSGAFSCIPWEVQGERLPLELPACC